MIDISNLREKLHNLSKAKVLCVGDIMLDKFTYGSVDRISPEAPIPVLHIKEKSLSIGGAGNVVHNLHTLGSHVICVGVIGNDRQGKQIKQLLETMESPAAYLVETNEVGTTVKTRFIANHQQILRVDQEDVQAYSDAVIQEVLRHALPAVRDVDVLILSDYGKGVLTPESIKALITEANRYHKPVIVDPKGSDYSIYKGATIVTPNRKELKEASRLSTNTDEEVTEAAKYITQHCGIANILATRSEQGMTLLEADGTVTHIPTFAQEVFDVSGAGDTVVATLASALAAGIPLKEAAYLANHAGGIVVAKVGTAPVHYHELVKALQDKHFEPSRKIYTVEDAIPVIKDWQAQGLLVGFTNGCFDLLHLGHLSSFQQAHRACDRLIVAVNSDASVQRLKGPTRPVQSETVRANVIAALEYTSMVIIFDEDTPQQLIETITPNVMFKGKDYTVDKIAGAQHVLAHGGKVVLLDLEPGYSTTNTIQRMS